MATKAPLSNDTIEKIVLGAVQMTGPKSVIENWDAEFNRNLKDLTVLVGEGSRAHETVQMIHGCKNFVGTVLAVKKEASSTRGRVILATKPTDNNKLGVESVRTERTDSSVEALEFCRYLASLVGRRVLVWVELQEREGRKFRILQRVEDLGPDSEYDEAEAADKIQAELAK